MNPPDWYPDPDKPKRLRYWDGEQWTKHTAPNNGRRTQRPAPPALGSAPKAMPEPVPARREPARPHRLDPEEVAALAPHVEPFQPRPKPAPRGEKKSKGKMVLVSAVVVGVLGGAAGTYAVLAQGGSSTPASAAPSSTTAPVDTPTPLTLPLVENLPLGEALVTLEEEGFTVVEATTPLGDEITDVEGWTACDIKVDVDPITDLATPLKVTAHDGTTDCMGLAVD